MKITELKSYKYSAPDSLNQISFNAKNQDINSDIINNYISAIKLIIENHIHIFG